jgi:hypothetical protein
MLSQQALADEVFSGTVDDLASGTRQIAGHLDEKSACRPVMVRPVFQP